MCWLKIFYFHKLCKHFFKINIFIGCPKIMLPFSKFYQTIKTYAKWTLACLFIELNSWSFWWHSQFFNCRQHAWCRPLFVQWRPACATPFSPWKRAFTCRPCCSPDTSRTCCSITTEPISMKLLANLYQCFVCNCVKYYGNGLACSGIIMKIVEPIGK